MTSRASDVQSSFLSHLEKLRNLLLECFLALGIFLIPALFLAPFCLDLFVLFIHQKVSVPLNYFSPLEIFLLHLKIAFLLDFIICLPYIAHRLWKFILPGLYESERRLIRLCALISCGLFILGVLCGFIFILPLIMTFGIGFEQENIRAVLNISTVISLFLWLSVSFGIVFQLPLLTVILVRCGLLSIQTLQAKRPYVIVGILVISALLTPPDIISQLMMAVPTYILFELALFFCRYLNRSPVKNKLTSKQIIPKVKKKRLK